MSGKYFESFFNSTNFLLGWMYILRSLVVELLCKGELGMDIHNVYQFLIHSVSMNPSAQRSLFVFCAQDARALAERSVELSGCDWSCWAKVHQCVDSIRDNAYLGTLQCIHWISFVESDRLKEIDSANVIHFLKFIFTCFDWMA